MLDRFAALDPTLRTRRALARIAARMWLPTDLASLAYAFEELLGEPAPSARRLLYDWFFYRQLEAASWSGRAHGGRAELLDAARVGAYVAECRRGIVVATIHLGDYLEGLRRLRLAAEWRKRVFVVRRAGWSEFETRAFERVAADLDVTVLRVGAGAAAIAVRELRRGNVVVALFDLPDRFGRAIDAELLGRRVRVVRGPAELAMLAGADVLPLFTHYDERGVSVVEADAVIDTARVAAASERDSVSRRAMRERCAAAITQRLWRLAEALIRAYPAQWSNWPMVAELRAVVATPHTASPTLPRDDGRSRTR
jgi:hypothetical protein